MRPVALPAVLALFPFAVVAQASTPQSTERDVAPQASSSSQPPSWSIGAGLGGGGGVFGFTAIAGQFVSLPSIPTVTASLERRLSDRSWGALGIAGAMSRQWLDVPPNGTGVTRSDATQLAVSGGVRYVLTPAGAPVDVSALALADVGLLRWDLDALDPAPTTRKDTGWLVGANAGIAVDRELTHRLSLRLATPLVAVRYFSSETTTTGEPTLGSTQFSASVVIAPRLELRLAF